MEPIEHFNGMQIIITDAITKTIRSRIHRKKRIDKKWLKRYGYKEIQDHSRILVFGNVLYMSKQNYDRLALKLNKMGE